MSSEIWKKEVTRLRGEYSQRVKLALHTNGRECLSWPTATSSDGEGGRIETILNKGGFKSKRKTSGQVRGAKLRDAVETYENWPTADATNVKGRTAPSNLREQVNPKSWPTPTVAEAGKISNRPNYGQKGLSNHPSIVGETVREKGKKDRKGEKSWPTPKSRDWKGGLGTDKARQRNDLDKRVLLDGLQDQGKSNTSGKSQESWPTVTVSDQYNPVPRHDHERKILRGVVHNINHSSKEAVAVGKLNPNWVEQLMGLPVGWTQLPTEWID